MNAIDLGFLTRPGVTIKGEIFNSKEPAVLLEDLVEVWLPDGRVIDVGWSPEHDPTGAFRVIVYREDSSKPLDRYSTTDPFQALVKVGEWIDSEERHSDDGQRREVAKSAKRNGG